ncbi:MAG: hypothetical protein ACOYON_05210 [Fimbriimonas sp.]
MNRFNFSRLVFGFAAVAVASVSLAQQGRVITPSRIERNVRPVVENTLTVVPQINTKYSLQALRPENPHPPITILPAPDNGMPVGGLLAASRGIPETRFPGIGATGWVPPDPNLAVGRNFIVSTVNCSVAFFTKTGTKTFEQQINGASGFFGSVGATNFVFDPKCFYDRIAKRFVVIGDELQDPDTSKICVAVSASENPNGAWFKYRFEAKQTVGGNTFWLDYPGLGYNKDAIVVTGNMFGLTGNSGWNGVQFIVIPKAPLLTGAPATSFSLSDTSGGSVQVGRNPDPNQTRVFAAGIESTTQMKLYAINNPGTTPTIVSTLVPIPTFIPLASDARSAAGHRLDSLDGRLFNIAVRGNKLYTAHNVTSNVGDSSIGCRWYEFNLGTWPASGNPTNSQAGIVAGVAGQDFHMNGIEANGAGDVSLIFTRSSSSIVADIMIAGRYNTDPKGTMGAPRRLVTAASNTYGGAGGTNRWGDYFDMAVDPLDDLTFWGVGMTSNSDGGWQTHIQSWKISTSILGTENRAVEIRKYQGDFADGALSTTFLSDDTRYKVKSELLANVGNVGGAYARYELGKPASALSTLRVQIEANGALGATGMVWFLNRQTNQYDHLGSFPLGTTDTNWEFTLNPDNIAKYVSNTGRLEVVARGLSPARAGRSTPFTFGIDQLLIFTREN